MKAKQTVNIFEYTDYRFYLRDYYAAQKQSNRHFSYRYVSLKSGVAASVLKDIISGRRNLSLTIMQKYAAFMRLSAREQDYFQHLVLFVNARTSRKKNEHFNQMIALRRKVSPKLLDERQYAYLSSWHHSAIRELVGMRGFIEDAEWISRTIKPRITPAQVRRSLALLQELKILHRDAQGRLAVCDDAISTAVELQSMVVRNYHGEMIRLGLGALERFAPAQREISSLTLGLTRTCFENIKTRLRSFKEEILSMVLEDANDSEMVCQLNVQLFPLVGDDAGMSSMDTADTATQGSDTQKERGT